MSFLDRFRRAAGPLPRDTVGLCRLLEQEGWEHLHAAEALGHGVILLIAGNDRETACRAAVAWLAPAAGVDDDGRTVDEPDDALARTLEAGERIVVCRPNGIEQARRLVARTGCAIVCAEIRVDGTARRLVLGAPGATGVDP